MKIGNVVKSKKYCRQQLKDGRLNTAVVISLDPFVLTSPSVNIRWDNFRPEMVEVIGDGIDFITKKCMRRL